MKRTLALQRAAASALLAGCGRQAGAARQRRRQRLHDDQPKLRQNGRELRLRQAGAPDARRRERLLGRRQALDAHRRHDRSGRREDDLPREHRGADAGLRDERDRHHRACEVLRRLLREQEPGAIARAATATANSPCAPAAEYEHFCEQVGSLCHVTYMSSSAENITEEYYDTDSRLKTAQIKLERLQELLEGGQYGGHHHH